MQFGKYFIDLSQPQVMGILNVTPDSFYDGSSDMKRINYSSPENISKYKFANIIDVGAESSRPGSNPISIKEEISRLSLVNLYKFKTGLLSIDSYKYNT